MLVLVLLHVLQVAQCDGVAAAALWGGGGARAKARRGGWAVKRGFCFVLAPGGRGGSIMKGQNAPGQNLEVTVVRRCVCVRSLAPSLRTCVACTHG